jgi:hypothetical protein
VEKKLIVFSVDFDGCLHTAIKNEDKYNKLIDSIIAEIKQIKIKEPTKEIVVKVFVGSQRQSKTNEDLMIKGGHGPCAGIYQKFTSDIKEKLESLKIEITLDKFLLGDIFSNLHPGSSYTQLAELDSQSKRLKENNLEDRSATNKQLKSTDHYVDHSKLLLIYSQAHFIASNTKDLIELKFYDDKKELLEKLKKFFKLFPNWLPDNITFTPYCYAKKDSVPVATGTICGTGVIDNNYINTIKNILVNLKLCSKDLLNSIYEQQYNLGENKNQNNVIKKIFMLKAIKNIMPTNIKNWEKLSNERHHEKIVLMDTALKEEVLGITDKEKINYSAQKAGFFFSSNNTGIVSRSSSVELFTLCQ